MNKLQSDRGMTKIPTADLSTIERIGLLSKEEIWKLGNYDSHGVSYKLQAEIYAARCLLLEMCKDIRQVRSLKSGRWTQDTLKNL